VGYLGYMRRLHGTSATRRCCHRFGLSRAGIWAGFILASSIGVFLPQNAYAEPPPSLVPRGISFSDHTYQSFAIPEDGLGYDERESLQGGGNIRLRHAREYAWQDSWSGFQFVCPLPMDIETREKCPRGWHRSRIREGGRTCTPPKVHTHTLNSHYLANPKPKRRRSGRAPARLPLYTVTCVGGALHGKATFWDYDSGTFTEGQYVMGYESGPHRTSTIPGWDDDGRVAIATPTEPKPKRRDYEGREEFRSDLFEWQHGQREHAERVKRTAKSRFVEGSCHPKLRVSRRQGVRGMEMYLPARADDGGPQARDFVWSQQAGSTSAGWFIVDFEQVDHGRESSTSFLGPSWGITSAGEWGERRAEQAFSGCARRASLPCLGQSEEKSGRWTHDRKTGQCVATRKSCKAVTDYQFKQLFEGHQLSVNRPRRQDYLSNDEYRDARERWKEISMEKATYMLKGGECVRTPRPKTP
jgi:hypothetical protein